MFYSFMCGEKRTITYYRLYTIRTINVLQYVTYHGCEHNYYSTMAMINFPIFYK